MLDAMGTKIVASLMSHKPFARGHLADDHFGRKGLEFRARDIIDEAAIPAHDRLKFAMATDSLIPSPRWLELFDHSSSPDASPLALTSSRNDGDFFLPFAIRAFALTLSASIFETADSIALLNSASARSRALSA